MLLTGKRYSLCLAATRSGAFFCDCRNAPLRVAAKQVPPAFARRNEVIPGSASFPLYRGLRCRRLPLRLAQIFFPTFGVRIGIDRLLRCIALGRMIIASVFLLPPRLVFAADFSVNLLQHRNAPPAPRPRRKAFGNLRRRLRFLPTAKALDLPKRNVKAEANRVVWLKGHESILAIN